LATGERIAGSQSAAESIALKLSGKTIGSFALEIVEKRPFRTRSGWLLVVIAIRDKAGAVSETPLTTGIVSAGGRGVKPWFECRLYPKVTFSDGRSVDARELGLEARIINKLGSLVPPGGHLMIDYESPGQEETFAELSLRVPPPASYLGSLMFRAGFCGEFKDWYFSEGGHEGPRKLQANKPLDAAALGRALESHQHELSAFLEQPLPAERSKAEIIQRAQERARALLRECRRKGRPR
jgi:hypothetical protein